MSREITRTVTEYMNSKGVFFSTREEAIRSDLEAALTTTGSLIKAIELLRAIKENPAILTLLKEYFEE